MNIIEAKIKKLELFNKQLALEILIELIKEYEPEILDWNRAQIEERGIKSDGKPISPLYTPFTVSIKKEKGQETNFVTLKDTGDFLDSFFIEYEPGKVIIGATDPKAKKLANQYDKEIFGITQPHKTELIDFLRPDLIEEFRKRLAA